MGYRGSWYGGGSSSFRQRLLSQPGQAWLFIGIDVGKYEHVAVAADGMGGMLVAPPLRFGIRGADYPRLVCVGLDCVGVWPFGHPRPCGCWSRPATIMNYWRKRLAERYPVPSKSTSCKPR